MTDQDFKIIAKAVVVKDRNKPLEVVKYLVSLAIYCVVGLGVDYWLYIPAGGVTLWASASTYMVMLFWPLILLWQFLVIVFWAALICLAICAIIMLYEKLV